MIERFAESIPAHLKLKSGAVFYSGRAAFDAPSRLYILGLNPGGSPQIQAGDTIAKHTDMVLNEKPQNWSEYQDEEWWEGRKPGTSGMQPRVLHLMKKLSFDPQKTPASDVVFLRSALERDIANTFREAAEDCWAFHQQVIERLSVRVILCFGQRAGNWVCEKLKAAKLADEFIEQNRRGWRSLAYRNAAGLTVVVATHPSRADWTSPKTDPSELVQRMLNP